MHPQGIAAVEALARLQGNWGKRDSYSEIVDRWVEKVKLTPDRSVIIKAHQVLKRVLSEPSELLELWQESEEFETWHASVQDLVARVRA
jgi:hypothetical protein